MNCSLQKIICFLFFQQPIKTIITVFSKSTRGSELQTQFWFKTTLHKSSLLLIIVAAAFVLSLLVAPVASISPNLCSSCHGTSYNQQIDLLESSSSIPSSLQVGQTVPLSVVIQNINNAPRNTLLSNVQVSLNSQSGRFSV